MKATIKGFDCVEHDPIEQWTPGDAADINVWVNFHIGSSISDRADNFQVHFVTANHLSELEVNSRYLVVDVFSILHLVQLVHDRLDIIDEPRWEQIAVKINEFSYWEFENYKPHVE